LSFWSNCCTFLCFSLYTDLNKDGIYNEKVVSIVSVMCKHTVSFFGFIPLSGNKISYRAVHVFPIGCDRKISEHNAIRDDLALMYQLVVKASTPEYENFLEGWKGII